MTTVIHDFGTAPQAAPRSSYYLDKEMHGTDEQMLERFAGADVVIVKSAAVHGQHGTFVYGVFKPNSASAALQ